MRKEEVFVLHIISSYITVCGLCGQYNFYKLVHTYKLHIMFPHNYVFSGQFVLDEQSCPCRSVVNVLTNKIY